MKRLPALILAATVILGGIHAVDYGGLVSSDSTFDKFGSENLVFTEKLDSSLYLKVPFTTDGSASLSTEFVYRFQWSDSQIDHFINLPLLKFNYSAHLDTGLMHIAAGRFSMADGSGKIFSQTSDGLFGSYSASMFMVSAYCGYTGAVSRNFTTMNEMGITQYSGFASDVYTSSLPYVVAGAELTLPNLFWGQSVGIGSWNFIGIQNLKSNKLYGTLALSGPIAGNLYHNTTAIFAGILGGDAWNFAGLASSQLTYYFDYKGLAANLGLTYASKEFQTVTVTTGLIRSEPWTNLFVPAISMSILPLPSLYMAAETNIALLADGEYTGIGLAGVVGYQLFSDVAFSVSAGHFFAKEQLKKQTKISIKAAISF